MRVTPIASSKLITPLLRHLPSIICLSAICLLVYFKSLGNGAVLLADDHEFLSDQGLLKFDWLTIFSSTHIAQYFPLSVASMALDWHACGPTPTCLHIGSLIYHVVNAVLVYFIGQRIFRLSRSFALLAALVFASHPMNVEVVSWISARNYVLSGLLQLSIFLCYSLYIRDTSTSQTVQKKRLLLMLCYVFFVLALFAKVVSVVVPLGLVLIDLTQRRCSLTASLKQKGLLLVLALPFVAIAVSHANRGARWLYSDLNPIERATWVAKGLVFHLGRMVFPNNLTFIYDVSSAVLGWTEWAGFLILASTLVLVPLKIKGLRTHAWLAAGMFLLYYLPVSKIYWFGSDAVFGDRYMYVPIAFVACAVATLLAHESKNRTKSILSAGALAAVIGYFAVVSYQQTAIWRDDEALFTDLVNKYPTSAIGQNDLGIVLLGKSDREGAKSRFERAIELTPTYVMPYPNLASIYEAQGQHQKAIDLYLKAVAIQPSLTQVYYLVGLIYRDSLHDPASAATYFKKAEDSRRR